LFLSEQKERNAENIKTPSISVFEADDLVK